MDDDTVRRTAFALLVRDHRPLSVDEVAQAMAERHETAEIVESVNRLVGEGLMDRAPTGTVVGAGGLTLGEGPHELLLRGREYRTWCAYDAIGIAAGLAEPGSVSTRCAVCQARIAIRLPDAALAQRPERLWLAAGGDDMRADFCTPTVLLCSVPHAEAWGARQGGRGRVLDLGQAWRLGAGAWAGYAREAERLAPFGP
jgi:hypothetical protein